MALRHKWTEHGTGKSRYWECPCTCVKGYVSMVMMYEKDGKRTTTAPPCTRTIKYKNEQDNKTSV